MSAVTRWGARIALLAAATAVSGVALVYTAPNVVRGEDRAALVGLPLATAPSANATAAALALASGQEPENLARAKALSRDAIADNPLEVSAVRTLAFALALEGKPEESMRLVRYGEALSRRDLLTELAVALDEKQKGNTAEAVRHYGHALTTTQRGYDLLIANVFDSAQDPEFAAALGQALAGDPPWKARFFGRYVAFSKSPDVLFNTVDAMWANGVPEDERVEAGRVAESLLRLGGEAEAARIIAQVAPSDGDPADGDPVRNGSFEVNDGPIMGWTYQTGASISAMPVVPDDPAYRSAGRILEMRAGSGHAGQVARQLVALAPGTYRLSARLWANDQADEGMPRVSVECSGEGGRIAELRRNRAQERVAMQFTVPTGCFVQYLRVEFGSSLFVADSRGWADDITIKPVQPAGG